jgi:hypothetical protein
MAIEYSTPSTRVVLRPLASPLPLGFLALGVATVAFASVQLSWISQSTESRAVLLLGCTGASRKAVDGRFGDQIEKVATCTPAAVISEANAPCDEMSPPQRVVVQLAYGCGRAGRGDLVGALVVD